MCRSYDNIIIQQILNYDGLVSAKYLTVMRVKWYTVKMYDGLMRLISCLYNVSGFTLRHFVLTVMSSPEKCSCECVFTSSSYFLSAL